VKLLRDGPRRRAQLAQELEGAYQASRTGIAGRAYGLGRAVMNGDPMIGIVMDKAPGGFVSPSRTENMTTEQEAAAKVEAAQWRAAVNERTLETLEAYRTRLLAGGQAYTGELQFFVDDTGAIRPIDFQALKPLPVDPAARDAAIASHNAEFQSHREALEAISKENAAKQGTPTP
jgi:hypothetical protein